MPDIWTPTVESPGATAAGALSQAQVSAHLWWAELACHDGTPYPRVWTPRAVALAAEFEILRAMAGHEPLTILSAYRTAAHNARVGGAKWSQHLWGRALDIKRPTRIDPTDWWQMALSCARQPGSQIRGLGRYQSFVHVDIRPWARLVTWEGPDAHVER